MEVRAIRRGFDGQVLRSRDDSSDGFKPEVFNFTGFKIWLEDEEVKDNLGSWMELTADGEKEYAKLAKSLKSKATKAKKTESPSS
jgi:hypothetical protein